MKQITFKRVRKTISCFKEPAWRRPILQGVAAALEHDKFLSGIACNTVVDIGANIGQFSLVVRKTSPDAKIFMFEPLSEPFNKLTRVFRHDENAFVFNNAVSPSIGEVAMNVSNSVDSSSLLEITNLQETLFPGTRAVSSEQVSMGPLDHFLDVSQISGPSLLKVDVQGYELEVLRGCESLLNYFDMVYCECSFCELYKGQALAHEVVDFLRSLGFIFSGVNNAQYDREGKSIQADFIFIRERA